MCTLQDMDLNEQLYQSVMDVQADKGNTISSPGGQNLVSQFFSELVLLIFFLQMLTFCQMLVVLHKLETVSGQIK